MLGSIPVTVGGRSRAQITELQQVSGALHTHPAEIESPCGRADADLGMSAGQVPCRGVLA